MQKEKLNRKNKGITLIALIITIIVMLILVGVSVSVSLNGGLFRTAKQATNKTQIETDKEQLFSAAIGAIGSDGKVNYEKLDSNLPEGFTGENGIYTSGKGNTYTVASNGSIERVLTVEDLQAKHTFEYYSTLGAAVEDVNNNTIGENADVEKANAVAGIYTENDEIHVVLLKDTALEARIQPYVDMTINLGGYTLTSADGVAIQPMSGELTIDGRLTGSKVQVSKAAGVNGRPIQAAGDVVIKGGKYILETSGVDTSCIKAVGNLSIYDANISCTGTGNINGIETAENKNLILSNCEITVNGTGENCYGINNQSKGAITNCKITVNSTGTNGSGIFNSSEVVLTNCDIKSTHSENNKGIYNTGTLTVNNSSIISYSNYVYGQDEYYESLSIGMANYGSLILNNCSVVGTHSGLSNHGYLEVDGGIYEGYGHGGFYFAGTGTTSYVKNATIRECDMPDGYSATANNNNAGFYIGGSEGNDNITVYMDNCDIYGSTQPIVLRGSSGEENNTLYISNSRITEGKKVRIDNDTHKLYIGVGCNFTADDTTLPSAVVTTTEVYTKK